MQVDMEVIRNLKPGQSLPYSLVTDAKWANADHTAIECMVTFAHISVPVIFLARPDDSMAHGREIFKRLVAGEFFGIAEYVNPDPEPAVANPNAGAPNVIG